MTASGEPTIFHACPGTLWKQAQAVGVYALSAVGGAFIHLSPLCALAQTLALHFAGRRDLVLLSVSPALLGPALRWEKSRGNLLFPHLYGDLPLAAVLGVDALPLDGKGVHILPARFTK